MRKIFMAAVVAGSLTAGLVMADTPKKPDAPKGDMKGSGSAAGSAKTPDKAGSGSAKAPDAGKGSGSGSGSGSAKKPK